MQPTPMSRIRTALGLLSAGLLALTVGLATPAAAADRFVDANTGDDNGVPNNCLNPATPWLGEAAIFNANAGAGSTTINATAKITLAQSLPTISSPITVNGNGFEIDAGDTGRPFFLQCGTVTIQNATITTSKFGRLS